MVDATFNAQEMKDLEGHLLMCVDSWFMELAGSLHKRLITSLYKKQCNNCRGSNLRMVNMIGMSILLMR